MIITMKPLREILAGNIERVITASHLSVKEIAASLKVSETTVHRWKAEKNSIPPDVANMEALAKLLNVDPVEFYKSPDNVVTLYGHAPLTNYMIIPDDIVEGLAHLHPRPEANVWTNIRVAIKEEQRAQEKKAASIKKA